MAKFRLKNTQPASRGFGTLLACLLGLIPLLALPAIAIHLQHWDLRWIGAYVILVNIITYWSYARDKRRAQEGEWRISEARLHLLELLGGWPGAFLAQYRLRHKCSKVSYQFTFWLIVGLWQFIAFDSLQGWKYSRAVMNWARNSSEHRK